MLISSLSLNLSDIKNMVSIPEFSSAACRVLKAYQCTHSLVGSESWNVQCGEILMIAVGRFYFCLSVVLFVTSHCWLARADFRSPGMLYNKNGGHSSFSPALCRFNMTRFAFFLYMLNENRLEGHVTDKL